MAPFTHPSLSAQRHNGPNLLGVGETTGAPYLAAKFFSLWLILCTYGTNSGLVMSVPFTSDWRVLVKLLFTFQRTDSVTACATN